MILQFAKYHASENDFLLLDDREARFPVSNAGFIQMLCKRRSGVGADGIVLLQPSEKADLRMRIFNADGNEVEMCGNGLRCLVDFAHVQGIPFFTVEIGNRIATCDWNEGNITVDLGSYQWTHASLAIPPYTVDVIDTGVPHAVVFADDHDQFSQIAPKIRSHSLLGKEGANVNFAVFKEGKFYTRTFERGVEAETGSCGSGAAAVGIAARQKYSIENPVIVVSSSQEELQVKVLQKSVRLSGKVTFVFHGFITV